MIREHLQTVCDALASHGIRAVMDPRAIDTPCAWVVADRIDDYYLDGTLKLAVRVVLIVREGPVLDTYDALDALLLPTLEALGGYVTDTDLGTSVTLPDGATAPAYELTLAI